MVEVSVRQLKDNLSEYLRRAEAGEQVVVTRRGKRMGVLSMQPAPPKERTLEEKLADLERRGFITPGSGEKLKLPKKRIKLRGSGPTVSEIIIRDRR